MKKIIFLLGIISSLSISAQSWSLTGNAGTTPGTNFIGTTDNKDLVFKVSNNFEVIRLSNFPNYNLIFAGRAVFNIDEDVDYFRIYNAPYDYNPLRIDGLNRVTFLEEDKFSGGRVVIGSTTLAICSDCNQYKLFVKDGIRTEKVKVDIATGVWADYVFKKDYQLRPLTEVEKFIAENGHLPEVPSEKEAIANGIELKEMNILLLKKVEELTLYMIEQNKVNKQQEAELNQKTKDIEDLKKAVNTLLTNKPNHQN